MPSSLTRVLPFVFEFSSRLPVSVCGTGTFEYLAAFLADMNSQPSLLLSVPRHNSDLRLPYFTKSHPRYLDEHPFARVAILSFHCFIISIGSTGISTCCPSYTPFGLYLGPDLPWADEPAPGNLSLSADRILTYLSLLIPAFSLLSAPLVLSI